jgi:hypothetical protein
VRKLCVRNLHQEYSEPPKQHQTTPTHIAHCHRHRIAPSGGGCGRSDHDGGGGGHTTGAKLVGATVSGRPMVGATVGTTRGEIKSKHFKTLADCSHTSSVPIESAGTKLRRDVAAFQKVIIVEKGSRVKVGTVDSELHRVPDIGIREIAFAICRRFGVLDCGTGQSRSGASL